MKRAALLLSLLLIGCSVTLLAKPCPPQGDSKDKNVRALDVLKNRPVAPGHTSGITLEEMLQPGDDTNRFQPTEGASIVGYVAAVKDGGLESCNCHSKTNRDTHIELAAALADTKKKNRHVIVEVTPLFRKQLGTTARLRKFIGQRVTVTGWMFFDQEHKQNAFNTNSRGSDIWRATAWEIHPVTSIALVSNTAAPYTRLASDERESLIRGEQDLSAWPFYYKRPSPTPSISNQR